MTDRLGELATPGQMVPNHSNMSEDIENGGGASVSTETEKELAKFNREADAIEKVYVWANKSINTISDTLSDPTLLPSVNPQLDTIEQKLDNVRVRLQRISKENKELASAKHTAPATMRIRITRTTKLANDFIAVISSLQKVRESHKAAATDSVKRDMLKANPQATDAEMDKALENPESDQLDVVMLQQQASTHEDNAQLRNQVDDLRHRNRDIHNLSKNIVQLHQMFQDMSILVNGQQELINEIEHNVSEVKTETKKAGEELEVALAHQRSARKKKICICILVFCIIIAIILAIVIPICIQGNCNFGSSSSSGSNDSGSGGSATPTPASTASDPSPNPATRELDHVIHDERRHKLFVQLHEGQDPE